MLKEEVEMWKFVFVALMLTVAIAVPALAEEAPEVSAEPEVTLDFAALSGEKVDLSTLCSATVDCLNGTSITCTSCESGAKACNGTPRDCSVGSPGSVICKVGSFNMRTVCENPCPPTYCPDEPECHYQYYFATGCCEPNNPTPGYYCPQVCE
jgi:hypothetical protein